MGEGNLSQLSSTSITYLVVDQGTFASTPIIHDEEASIISTEIAVIAVVVVACIIGIAAFWALMNRK
ncbi:MAG: hypothetical protein CW691_01905 [Candidatus Bathyarchaeum sp.]|nr:MAG: hypothetical protein CW691_01905 [Candidatus Bathyarchaeum sp.]